MKLQMISGLIKIEWNWIVLLGLVFIAACTYNVEEELYPDMACISRDMSYSFDILPLIERNCYKCHDAKNNFGNVTLEGYNGLKKYVDNGKLVGVINHNPGFPPMPRGQTKLLGCDIEKIESWIADGALNN